MSSCGSRAATVARTSRPSESRIRAPVPRATWALVTTSPSVRQITPDPPRRPPPSTCTVAWRTRSAVAGKSSIRVSGMSVLALCAFAHGDLHLGVRAAAHDRGLQALADAVRAELRVYVVIIGNRGPVELQQHVANQHACFPGGAVRV